MQKLPTHKKVTMFAVQQHKITLFRALSRVYSVLLGNFGSSASLQLNLTSGNLYQADAQDLSKKTPPCISPVLRFVAIPKIY